MTFLPVSENARNGSPMCACARACEKHPSGGARVFAARLSVHVTIPSRSCSIGLVRGGSTLVAHRPLYKTAFMGLVIIVPMLLIGACSTGPGGTDGYPRVAGTYTGPVTVQMTEVGIKLVGSLRLNVEQAGAEVTISGSVTFGDVTTNLTATSGTINRTGNFTATQSGVIDPDALADDSLCGRLRPVTSSLAFSGDKAILEASLQTDYCGPILYDATLTR